MATTTPRGTGGPPGDGRGGRLNLAIEAGGTDGWPFSLPGPATTARGGHRSGPPFRSRHPGPLIRGAIPSRE